jgi:hypothetical protein
MFVDDQEIQQVENEDNCPLTHESDETKIHKETVSGYRKLEQTKAQRME